MQFWSGPDAFPRLFCTCTSRAFHLETQDTYTVAEETESVRKFIAGEPDDPEDWFDPWDALIRKVTGGGRLVQRARIVTVPHADYTRWLLAGTHDNLAAGEDVRWLPRHLSDPKDAVTDDYWLIDDHTVAYTVFTPTEFAGIAVTYDPRLVSLCTGVYERVWAAAIPHSSYINGGNVTTARP